MKVGADMKPRIFVSSTFYDLKYIREDLSNFVKAHDFEPIMFEDGDIGYTPGKALDKSCYDTMKNSDMVILIIGGQYGSPATGEQKDEFKEYVSVTRKEFKTAVDEGIPMFAFIDSKVYSEYAVYELNLEQVEKGETKIKFRAVKDINVFRFIREVKAIGNISITEFDKVSVVKDFLSKQWSDMFKQYLQYLRDEQKNTKMEATIDEMKSLIKKMDIMLESVGEKVLTEDNENNLEDVKIKQEVSKVCDLIINSFGFSSKKKIEGNIQERRILANRVIDGLKKLVDKFMEKDIEDLDFVPLEFITKALDSDEFIMDTVKRFFYLRDLKKIQSVIENPSKRYLLIEELSKEENYMKLLSP